MDRNRKIILSMLLLVVVACILAVIDISLKMKTVERKEITLQVPDFGPGVGVVKVYGEISVSGSGGSYLGIGDGTDALIKKLSRLEENKKIKAVVLRINSPGGSSAASEEVFKKLMEMRSRNIILVASMGEVAASGGYYIASACNYILANNSTLTGSIGAITLSTNVKGLFERFGVKMNVIKSGKYKDMGSPFKDLSANEKELLQEMIDTAYMKFLKDVSLGRNIPISEIQPYADGRIMSGETALKYKLIDGIGSYEEAVRKAKSLAKLPENAPVYDQQGSALEQILKSIDSKINSSNPIGNLIKQKKYSMIEYSIEP